MNLMGHESEDEEHYALDVDGSEPGTWNADDCTHDGSTDPGSEDIEVMLTMKRGANAEATRAENCEIQ